MAAPLEEILSHQISQCYVGETGESPPSGWSQRIQTPNPSHERFRVESLKRSALHDEPEFGDFFEACNRATNDQFTLFVNHLRKQHFAGLEMSTASAMTTYLQGLIARFQKDYPRSLTPEQFHSWRETLQLLSFPFQEIAELRMNGSEISEEMTRNIRAGVNALLQVSPTIVGITDSVLKPQRMRARELNDALSYFRIAVNQSRGMEFLSSSIVHVTKKLEPIPLQTWRSGLGRDLKETAHHILVDLAPEKLLHFYVCQAPPNLRPSRAVQTDMLGLLQKYKTQWVRIERSIRQLPDKPTLKESVDLLDSIDSELGPWTQAVCRTDTNDSPPAMKEWREHALHFQRMLRFQSPHLFLQRQLHRSLSLSCIGNQDRINDIQNSLATVKVLLPYAIELGKTDDPHPFYKKFAEIADHLEKKWIEKEMDSLRSPHFVEMARLPDEIKEFLFVHLHEQWFKAHALFEEYEDPNFEDLYLAKLLMAMIGFELSTSYEKLRPRYLVAHPKPKQVHHRGKGPKKAQKNKIPKAASALQATPSFHQTSKRLLEGLSDKLEPILKNSAKRRKVVQILQQAGYEEVANRGKGSRHLFKKKGFPTLVIPHHISKEASEGLLKSMQ